MSAPTPQPRPTPGPPVGNPRRTTPPVSRPTIRETSAGGVVTHVAGGETFAAVIARRNRAGRLEWCLPKGHLEPGESAVDAAVREILEETGLHADIVAEIGTLDYWFHIDSHRVHKVVHHYLLRATGGELTTKNDPDGESVDVAWVPIDELAGRLAFTNERRIAHLAVEAIQGLS